MNLKILAVGLVGLAVAFMGATALPALASAAGSPTPRQAAHATRACLIGHDWSARLTDHGAGVLAKAPRLRSGFTGGWAHPWFSVTFYRYGAGTGAGEIRTGLNRRENAIATSCKRAGWRR